MKPDDFALSLPASYRERFSREDIAAHARIVAEARAPIDVGVFRRSKGLCGVCIVANDEAGLLSKITAAIVRCELDIANAEAFTRTHDPPQAVDIFWLKRMSGAACGDADVEMLRVALHESLSIGLTPATPRSYTNKGEVSDTRVRFLEDSSGALNTLEIETEDRAGLLLSLSRALYLQNVQIVHSEIRTRRGRCLDRFQIAELDGSPVGPARRLEIQVAVLSAAEPAKRLTSAPPPKPD